MTDKELLELAAKAAGYSVHIIDLNCGSLFQVELPDGKSSESWNPLTNDGDAFRLQVKLEMEIYRECLDFDGNQRSVSATAKQLICEEEFCNNEDPCSATRRAIVRAAAEVGKAMK